MVEEILVKHGLFDEAGHTAGAARMPVCWCCGEDVDFAQDYRPVLPYRRDRERRSSGGVGRRHMGWQLEVSTRNGGVSVAMTSYYSAHIHAETPSGGYRPYRQARSGSGSATYRRLRERRAPNRRGTA